MNAKLPKPEERMRRMREMFSENLAILAEDYEFFAGVNLPDVATRPNRGCDKSAGSRGRPALERN